MAYAVDQLKARMREVGRLGSVRAILEWDQETQMPPRGASERAEQLALLTRIHHDWLTSPETARLLDLAEAETSDADPDSDDARLTAVTRRDYERAARIPSELAEELGRHVSQSLVIWQEARARKEFARFAPALEKMVQLVRETAERIGYDEEAYDALLDGFEPGARTAEIAALFETLKPPLVALSAAIAEAGPQEEPLTGHFPIPAQKALTERVVAAIGYDFQRGRQDVAVHPFCTTFSRDDVRITTRFDESRPDSALYSSLHEAGHALYELGSPLEYDQTPLGGGASSGVHESQSRFWENVVGRSRAFCEWALPLIREAFPGAASDWDAERFYRAVNRVQPSFIRVEADEVTYNLHVLLRFELERALVEGRIRVAELPEAWNERMRAYLGITPSDDALGVLQDVHWSVGLFGYFPTYTLGNVMAGQLWETLAHDAPDAVAGIANGEFAPILDWLRQRVHRHGRKFLPDEVIRRATGRALSPEPYLQYLRAKYAGIYGLD